MGRSAPSYTLKTWKIEDLKRSELNARGPFLSTDERLNSLAESIRKRGILQDPAVRSDGTIIYGTRRVFAAGLAGLKEISCKTYAKGLTAIEEHTLRIEENLEREDLNPIEKAKELASFVAMQPGKGKQKTVAGLLGISETAVSRALDLLALPAIWHELVANGTANPAHTRPVALASKVHELLPTELARVYGQLAKSKSMSVKDWEAEVARYLEERTQPVTAEGSRTILPIYANQKAELDIRLVNGHLVAFNLDLWRKLTREAEAKQQKEAEEAGEESEAGLPAMGIRRRIAQGWLNRRIITHLQKHAATAMKWFSLLEIPLPVRAEALFNSQAREDWSLDPMKSIEVIGKIRGNQVSTFMADHLKAACAIALKGNGWFVKDWHQAVAMAAAMGINYAVDFLLDLSDQDKAEIMDAYGQLPALGRYPKGMDPRSLGVPKFKG